MVVMVWAAERGFPVLDLALEVGVLVEVPRLREVFGVEEQAWALIFERRWVMALGVTSSGEVRGWLKHGCV